MIDLLASRSFGPAEVKDARARLDLSHADLAERLGVSVHRVREWEDGTARVPRRVAKTLAWDAALVERADAFAASGIERCAWLIEREPELDGIRGDPDALERYGQAVDEHQATCEACRARFAWEDTRPPLPDMPMSGWMSAFVRFVEQVERLPAWLRPAAYGAVILGALMLLRMAGLLLAVQPSWPLVGTVLFGILAGAVLGAVGGGAYALVREPFRRFGRVGDYLTGIACAYAYVLTFMGFDAAFSSEPTFTFPAAFPFGAVLSIPIGLLLGHMLIRKI